MKHENIGPGRKIKMAVVNNPHNPTTSMPVLDPVLIFVFNLRVIGAALATILAQIIVTLVFLYNAKNLDLFRNIRILSKPKLNHISEILKIGFPSSVQSMLFTCISMYIARLISSFGAISVAVQKVGSQIEYKDEYRV